MRRAARDVERLLRQCALGDGRAGGRDVVEALAVQFGFSVAAIHRLERSDDGWDFGFHYTHQFDDESLGRYRAYASQAPRGWIPYDPLRPSRAQRNRALALADLRVRGATRDTTATVFPSVGLAGLDQLRMLVCDGPLLLAWVGGFRERPFREHEKRRLQTLVPLLQNWLVVDQWQRRARVLESSLENVLDQFGAQAMLVDRAGHTVFATAAARGMTRADRKALADEGARDEGGGAGWTVSRLTEPGMPELTLLIRNELSSATRASLDQRARDWGLTKRQREVLEHLALGEANKCIAERLGCSPATIEAHLTAIYRRARVSCRTELLAALWRV